MPGCGRRKRRIHGDHFLLGSLAACHAGGRADVRYGKSRPLHIHLRNPNRKIQVFFRLYKMVMIAWAIIRHLGREVRAIRDLLITCLSIKETNKKAVKTITLQRADNRFPISFVTSL